MNMNPPGRIVMHSDRADRFIMDMLALGGGEAPGTFGTVDLNRLLENRAGPGSSLTYQLFYNLSAPGLEDLLCEAESVRRFVALSLSGPLPDETTILNFLHPLEKRGLGRGLFEEINAHLESQGLRLREGTIVDTSIIEAPSSTKNRVGERDPEMRQTKKGNERHFGMRVQIGVDADTGIVHSVTATAANAHDVTKRNCYINRQPKMPPSRSPGHPQTSNEFLNSAHGEGVGILASSLGSARVVPMLPSAVSVRCAGEVAVCHGSINRQALFFHQGHGIRSSDAVYSFAPTGMLGRTVAILPKAIELLS